MGNKEDILSVATRLFAATFLGTINTFIAFFLNGYAELDDNACHSLVRQFSHGIYS
jgi:hypothetical protein